MSVNAGDQQEGKLKVLIMARSLASYTIKICSNAKWFPPEYQTALTNSYKLIQRMDEYYRNLWRS